MKNSSHMQVSSLTSQCLNNLRKGTNNTKMHLLGFMSQFIDDQVQIPKQQVDELCCYDRMKKLLVKNKQNKKQQYNHQNQDSLAKAIQIQAKINQMQRQCKQKQAEQQKNQLRKKAIKSKTQHFSCKSFNIDQLREKGYQKFIQIQRMKKQKEIIQAKTNFDKEIQTKLGNMIEQKDLQKVRLTQENKNLQRRILQKNVEIQTLKSECNYQRQYIKQMEVKLAQVSNHFQKTELIAKYQKWISQFKQQFGEISIKDLSKHLQTITDKCLDKFSQIQVKNQENLVELKTNLQSKGTKLKKQIQKMQLRENELIQANKNLKLNKQISQMETNQLLKSKQDLKALQQLILSLYNDWYALRTENQKSLMKTFGKLKQNYSYEQMLKYIVDYQNKHSTNDKLNDYILKILRGIQKIRRTIFPLQSNEKIDPFFVLQKIQSWVKSKIRFQHRRLNNSKQITSEFNQNKYLGD